jgi:transporter family protein
MHLPVWFFLAGVVLLFWGALGIFMKLSTTYISAESAIIWIIIGFVLLQPFIDTGRSLFRYSGRSVMWGLASGALGNLAAWGLCAALRSGGKASVVSPICALYPLIVVLASPFVLHESITLTQGCGIVCALVAVVLLSAERSEV